MKLKSNIVTAVLLATTVSAWAGPITLAGDTIDASIERTVPSWWGSGRVYGYGLDGPFVVQEGPQDTHNYSAVFDLNVDGLLFSIDFLTTAGWQEGIVLRLTDLSFAPGTFLSSLTVDTNIQGYSVRTSSDSVEIGLGGTRFTADSYFTGRFNVSQVPEPATLSLLAVGLLGTAISTRRKTRKAGQ